MREVALDFQPRRPGLLPVVLFLAALLLAADAGFEASALGDQAAEVAARLAQAQRRAERRTAARRDSQPEHALSPDEAKALRQAFAAIQVDWESLYGAIDAAGSEDIALLAIRPSVTGKSVQISGEARTLAAALAYVEALRQEPLAQVVLVSHQIRQTDPQRPIAFEIAATWHTGS